MARGHALRRRTQSRPRKPSAAFAGVYRQAVSDPRKTRSKRISIVSPVGLVTPGLRPLHLTRSRHLHRFGPGPGCSDRGPSGRRRRAAGLADHLPEPVVRPVPTRRLGPDLHRLFDRSCFHHHLDRGRFPRRQPSRTIRLKFRQRTARRPSLRFPSLCLSPPSLMIQSIRKLQISKNNNGG